MPEQFNPSQQPELSAASEQAERGAVGSEMQMACGDLASECSDTLNETPEGRLQLVCAEAGLSLNEGDPVKLLKNRHLQVAFRRPLPMPPAIRERCLVILQAELEGVEPPDSVVKTPEIAALEAATEGKSNTLDTIETHVADIDVKIETAQNEKTVLDQIGAEQAETIEAQAAVIDDFFQTKVQAGTLGQIREQINVELSKTLSGSDLTQKMTEVEAKYIAPHKEKLTAMQAVFTPEEIQRVFGGSLTNTVSLNLRGENNARIYADVFARIDAGFANDDDRRREVRAQVEAQLGITMHAVERPANASELQSTLRNGRGTEEIREIQRVEEPPGSGNFVEKEVVVGERTLPFTGKDPLVLSINPQITVFPDPPGGVRHRVVGEVSGGKPVHIFINVPPEGAFPAAAINNRMNEQMQNTIFRNKGMTGVLEYFHGRGDSSLGAASETNFDSVGQNDMTQAIMKTFIGENTTLGGRFITGAELNSMGYDLRHLAPDGDFGAFNQMDPALANSLMTGMFGSGREEIMANLQRAGQFINTGGAETPSYQALYAQMQPEDAAAGYPHLREVIGDNGMAVLNFGKGEEE